ncbi:ADP-ribosylglycohydrolase [Thermopolyspora flexuosa]|uniref:ADP-ribosylglycohydrolase n=1 Tax=Thermopolyspora flexuosa TaxID=103836 RepID=A0A543J1R0_9ACTN|nr:ADP-ribosylglycohydrolase [Thermopolyspora flexuosa]
MTHPAVPYRFDDGCGVEHVKRAATGTLLGLAVGDALGYPAEFLGVGEITARYGPWRAMTLIVSGGRVLVSDDTQMTLAVAEALADATAAGPLTPDRLVGPLRDRFLAWWRSPDNDRAPGTTCLRACALLGDGRPWQAASQTGSKGCGANMRVAPVALVPGLDGPTRSAAAQLQAALTHGHPTALAAADLTAHAVRLLADGTDPAELVAALRDHAKASRTVYHGDWLGDLAARAGAADPAAYLARGWDECLAVLDRLERALAAPDLEADPCLATGAGWTAEEAFATGLYCFLLLPGDPLAAVRRAACSSGDSDSIAALTGAFAGAWHGAAAWPADWTAHLEHRDRLLALGAAWDA